MVKGETPPNWEDLCKYSYESSTDEAVDEAMNWLAGQDNSVVTGRDNTASTAPMMGSPGQRISDPFALLPDQQDVNSTTNGNATSTLHANSEGERDHPLQRSSTKRVRDASDDVISRKRVAAEVGAVRMDQIRTLNVSVDVGVDVGDVKVEMAVGQNLWIKF